MGLDYTNGCVNFRDVGVWINEISGKDILPPDKILRGGKLEFIHSLDEIGNPGSIVNLRKGPDPMQRFPNIQYFHFPISNDYEKYQTENKVVRRWLNTIFNTMETRIDNFPVFFHCTSGKDRTGVVVAALLKILGVQDEYIIEEYLLSDGEVNIEWITSSLNGIIPTETYFNRVELDKLRKVVMEIEN